MAGMNEQMNDAPTKCIVQTRKEIQSNVFFNRQSFSLRVIAFGAQTVRR